MLTDFLTQRILRELPFSPNDGQRELIAQLSHFLTERSSNRLFLLRGYAGTGKTSVIGSLVRMMRSLSQPTRLLAPTGRAAKVMAAYSNSPAYTIHKQIYRQRKMGEPFFSLSQNTLQNTLFIVDEASMIPNTNDTQQFGTGCLLNDLIEYVYSNPTCAMILVGDDAQLPPVGQLESLALNSDYLTGYGLNVTTCTLTQVARQAEESGILFNATNIRTQLFNNHITDRPEILTKGFKDISLMGGQAFLEALERSYREVGEDETIMLTRTNRRMNLYNQGIRSRILWREEELTGGDRMMVTRNNYYWTKQYEGIDFLANGDMLSVVRLRREREMYGFRFADATLHSLDYDWDIDATVWLDTLSAESAEQCYQMQQTLFSRIAEDYPEIRSKAELSKKIMDDPYYNALQIKHAYSITCHKAQGGQWENVFIDPGTISDEHLGEGFLRWYYTALTRAKGNVFILNN